MQSLKTTHMANERENLKQFIAKKSDKTFWNVFTILTKLFPEAEMYLVGGMVRDIARGEESADYDFVIKDVPTNTIQKKLSTVGKVELVGKTFGVYKWKPEGEKFHVDIALPRTDHAFGTGGYKDVDVQFDHTLHIHKDLERRDFTVNAVALRLNDGEIFDPYNGLKDIQENILRAVGDPHTRFKEDYSRLLRGIRFTCQLNFSLEPKTSEALVQYILRLNDTLEDGTWKVPRELVAKEMLKAFVANPIKALDSYDRYGALKLLLPEVCDMKGCEQPPNWHSEGDVYVHTKLAISNIFSQEFTHEFNTSFEALSKEKPKTAALVIFAILFHDLGKPPTMQTPEKDGTDRIRYNNHDSVGAQLAGDICERLALSAPEKHGINCGDLVWIVRNHMVHVMGEITEMKNTTIEKYFFNDNVPGDALIMTMWADASATIQEETKGPSFSGYNALLKKLAEVRMFLDDRDRLPEALLNGNEIMKALKLPSSPELGTIIEALREEQLTGNISTPEEALVFIKKYKT